VGQEDHEKERYNEGGRAKLVMCSKAEGGITRSETGEVKKKRHHEPAGGKKVLCKKLYLAAQGGSIYQKLNKQKRGGKRESMGQNQYAFLK